MKSSRANVRLASFWLTGLLFCQSLPASLAGPVPPAKNQPLKIPGDCKPRTVGQATMLTFCLERPASPEQRGYFSIQVEKNDAPVYQTRASWIPEANEDLDAVAVLGINQRWLGISYDFCECTVVKVVDLERKQLALDTGCWHAGYYGIKEFPEKDRCEVVLQSGEGDNNPVVRPDHRYDICRQRVDLSKTGQALHKNFRYQGGPRHLDKMPIKPILPEEAAGIARDRLEEKGVKDIVIFRASWIAAPLTGYLVDAAGAWQVGKKRFSLFRIGVRDGGEEAFGERAAGEEFVFLATGTDEKNRRIWHPEPGPDHRVPAGAENFFLFGLTAEEVDATRGHYDPAAIINADEDLRRVMGLLTSGHFNLFEPGIFDPIIDAIYSPGDPWLTAADFRSYIDSQREVDLAYKDRDEWTRMSIINTATSGKFSSDRTILDYNREVWGLPQVAPKQP